MLKTRMQNVFESIMQSFDQASGAMKKMDDSTGALDQSYSKYLDSIQGKSAQLTATFQDLSTQLINADWFKSLISGANSFLNVLTDLAKKPEVFASAAIAAIAAIRSAWNNEGFFKVSEDKLSSSFKDTFLAPFKALGEILPGNKNTINFGELMPDLSSDIADLEAYTLVAKDFGSKQEAINQMLGQSSSALKQYVAQTDAANISVDGFRQSQEANAVAISAQNQSLGNVRVLLNTYNEGLANTALNQSQFANAVGQSNPILQQYLKKVGNGQATMRGYIGSLISAKVASIGLQVATTLLNAALSYGITALIQLAAGLISKLLALIPTVKNTSEALSKSAEQVTNLSSKLKSLSDEIKTTDERIAELQLKADKGTISLVEQNELDRLIAYNAELNSNKALTEDYLKTAQSINADNFAKSIDAQQKELEWYEKIAEGAWGVLSSIASGSTSGGTLPGKILNEYNKYGADSNRAKADFEQNLADFKTMRKQLEDAEVRGEDTTKLQEDLAKKRNALNDYVSGLQESYSKLGTYDYDSLSDSAKEAVDYFLDTQNQYLLTTSDNLSETVENVMSSVYNSSRFKEAREAIQSLPELTGESLSQLAASNPQVGAFIDNLIKIGAIKFDGTSEAFDGLAKDIDNIIDKDKLLDALEEAQQKEFESLKSQVDSLKDAYSKVSSAIEEFNTYGALSADTIKDLISLEPEYLNLLMDENGQLNLTSESYTELYRAKLRDMLVSQVKTTLDNILDMKEEEAAAYALANAYDTETNSLEALVEAEFRAAYASAATKDAANNTTVYTDAVNRYATIVPTLMSLVNSAQIDAAESTNVATDALNAQKDALEDEKDALEDQKDALEDQKDALEDLKDEWEDYKDDLSDAKDKIQDLIDVTVDYIKQTKEDEKEAISERKDAFDELIEKEKEELEVKKEAADFADTLREKENAVAKNALSAAIASLDDSGAGQKARKQAEDDLAESRADLYSELADHEYDVRVAALEDLQEYFDEYYDSETEKIETYLDDERQIYNDACAMIENDTGDLYAKLWQYTYEHTTKTRAEFDNMWNSAQAAMEEYNVAQYGVIGVMEFLNSEIYGCEAQIAALDSQIDILDGNIDILDQSIDELDERIDSVSESIEALADNSIDKLTTSIGNLKKELASLGNDYVSNDTDNSGSNMVAGLPNAGSAVANSTVSKLRAAPISQAPTITQTVFKTNYGYTDGNGRSVTLYSDGRGNYYLDSAHRRPVKIVNLSSGKLENTFKRVHFASGTMSAPGGVSEVNENGHEIRILNKGDGILTAKITKNLARLGADPAGVLADAGKQLLKSLSNVALRDDVASKLYNSVYGVSPNSSQPITVVNHIQGDVNPSTLKALVSAQKQITRDAVSEMMRKTTQLRYNTAVY